MRHAGAGAREQADLGGIELNAVRVPYVGTGPAEVLGILPRPAAEPLERERDIVGVLGEMGVQHHALVACEQRRLAHQLGADRERRARRDGDADHRAVERIVEPVDHPDGVGEDRVLVLDQRVGRQPARALAHAHAAARGVEADADRVRGFDRVVERHSIGEHVMVVRAQRAARQRQLRKAELRRGEHVLRAISGQIG